MDPFVIFIITLLTVTGGGAGSVAVYLRRARRRAEMRDAVLEKRPHQGRRVSLFDVFWDLGVSDYALALMEHQGLVLEDAGEGDLAHQKLDELIGQHGGYDAYLRDTLDAIQEFYREHKHAGSRRKLPTLKMTHQKLLPVTGDSEERSTEGALVRHVGEQPPAPFGRPGDDSLVARQRYREERVPDVVSVAPEPLRAGRAGNVDVDEIVSLDVLGMLTSLFEGQFTSQVQKWWSMRKVRSYKEELDSQFIELYRYYADLAHSRPDFYDALYDTARRWGDEVRRIRQLERRAPWSDKSWALCAAVMAAQAKKVARQLSERAQTNTDETIERIHEHARRGDFAMAGYLLYLNHHAFFAGRAPDYGRYVERIERTAHRVQEELRQLKRKGVI